MHPIQSVFPVSGYLPLGVEIGLTPIPVTNLKFKCAPVEYSAERSKTLARKHLVMCDGEPAYSELAVVKMLINSGWTAVWIDSFHRRVWKSMREFQKLTVGSPLPSMPPKISKNFWTIVGSVEGKLGGCWDILAAQGDAVAFLELKEKGPDQIRSNQIRWYETAIRHGISAESFRLVEWTLVR